MPSSLRPVAWCTDFNVTVYAIMTRLRELSSKNFQLKHRLKTLGMLTLVKMRLYYLCAKNAPPLLGSVEASQVWSQSDTSVKWHLSYQTCLKMAPRRYNRILLLNRALFWATSTCCFQVCCRYEECGWMTELQETCKWHKTRGSEQPYTPMGHERQQNRQHWSTAQTSACN